MSDGAFDLIVVGGGLAGTLIAYRLRQRRPDLRLLLLESRDCLGGSHTWSFHDTDIAPEARSWVAPFVAHRWAEQQVRFPKYTRTLRSGYSTIFSSTLHGVASQALHGCVSYGARVRNIQPRRVFLESGQALSADCVIDCRGGQRWAGLALAYQKFMGLVVRCVEPHGQSVPIIMDATVPQWDGYRFVYTLPFSKDELLIEDTYYSDKPALDIGVLRDRCVDYARQRGWAIAEVLREEHGVLPVVLGGTAESILEGKENGVPCLGVGGGFFHHTTSYSLPFAVRCADAIAAIAPLTSEAVDLEAQKWLHAHWRRQHFFRLLNRMLFRAADHDERYRILERFYELGEALIQRFYSSELSAWDRVRILSGWPPVPIHRALAAMVESRADQVASAASSG